MTSAKVESIEPVIVRCVKHWRIKFKYKGNIREAITGKRIDAETIQMVRKNPSIYWKIIWHITEKGTRIIEEIRYNKHAPSNL